MVAVAVAVVSVEALIDASHLEGPGSKSRNLCLRKFGKRGAGQDGELRTLIK